MHVDCIAIFCVVITILHSLIIVCDAELFNKINGYRINATFSKIIISVGDQKMCCYQCMENGGCNSVNYNSVTKQCEFADKTPYDGVADIHQASEWDIYFTKTSGTNDWELLFRTHAGNGISPYMAWTNNTYHVSHDDYRCRLMTSAACPTFYRSPVVDQWESLARKEVKIAFYKGGHQVAYSRFNADGTNTTNWFRPDLVIDTGWQLMNSSQTFLYFSLRGHAPRTFFMERNYGGCSVDYGWMVVHDLPSVWSRTFTCAWDIKSSFPQFLYSTGNDGTVWQTFEYGFAEVLAIFIKRQ